MNKQSSLPIRPLKLIKIGNSTGVVLPKELLDQMGLKQGDSLSAAAVKDGFTLKITDSEFAQQMSTAREVMKRRKHALRELAK